MKRRSHWLLLAAVMLISSGSLSAQPAEPPLIPRPRQIVMHTGRMHLTIGAPILVDERTREVGEYMAKYLSRASGAEFQVRDYVPGQGVYAAWDDDADIGVLVLLTGPALDNLGSEGYRLAIDSNSVVITAPSADGVFHGCQTLRQLLPATSEMGRVHDAGWMLPQMEIVDTPRFGWRGLMVDCSRTFQSVEYLRKLIDLLALYKMNVLHLHLTDDQGWRVQIDRYPELTGAGARFPERFNKQSGFYSKDEIRNLVKYASLRRVTLVPEIEMPGHCLGALAAYPELSCSGGPFEIKPFFMCPGILDDVFCVGNEEVFTFLQNVLDEVVDLFPSNFIHVGGDEVHKTRWKQCPKCQARIRQESLKNEDELQSHFIRRIENHLNGKRRQLIGWDEILQGGLAPRATVMCWRGVRGGIKAARQGHDVVMSPTSHCYLDYDHERISVEQAYSFEPVPQELTGDQAKHVLGLQGNIWTHIAVDERAVDRQVFPRLIALAEVGWTETSRKSWEGFSARLTRHYGRLEELDVYYYRK